MKANEIQVGGIYRAKISGNFVDVRVDAIRETTKRGRQTGYSGLPNYVDAVVYDVTNLTTGRRTTFKTAGKFRHEVKPAVTPGRRPNECMNPELEVMLRQVSPKLNAEVREAAVAILGEDLVARQEEIHAEEQDAQHTAILIAEVNARQGREMEEAIGPIDEADMDRLGEQIDAEFGPFEL